MARSRAQIVDSLLQEVSKFKMVDDNGLALAREWLGDKIDSYRATVIKRAIEEKKNIDSCYQIIPCLDVECVSYDCVIEGIEVKASTSLYKTKIPELLDIEGVIKFFGFHDMITPFTKNQFYELAQSQSRWGRPVRKYSRIGNELFWINYEGNRKMLLIAILANPLDACESDSTDVYPLGKEHEQTLELLVKKDLYQMLNIPVDNTNDTVDNQGAMPRQKQQQQDGSQ